MTGKLFVGLVLLLVGCSPSTGQPTGTVKTSTSRTSSPVAASPKPPLPVTTVGFQCVLPVYGYAGVSTGAFIVFPSRTLTAAAESGYYYDRAVSRWVPVHRWQVSPDGLSYAYTEGWSVDPPKAPRLHITNAATREDLRVVTMPAAQPYQVIDFTSAAVYLVISFEGTGPGVWRVDRSTGTLAKISNGAYPPSGAAWVGVVDPRDPQPHHSTFTGRAEPNRIDRRDEAGHSTTWFYEPGYSLSWAAFSGAPALLVSGFYQATPTSAYRQVYWLVDRPGHATKLSFTFRDFNEPLSGFGGAIADVHGIWIGNGTSLYLARRDGAILRVFGSSVYPANGCS